MFLSNVKRKIKSNSFLYELLMSYRVSGQYGYIRTNREVSRLYCAVLKVKGANNTTEICQDSRFVFIGDKNPDSTMRTAVFGDIDKGNTKECQCEFFTSRCLKNPNLNGLHNIFWRVNKIVPLPFKSFWDFHYTTYDLKIDSDKNNYIIFLAGAYFEETFSQPNLWKKIAVESGGGYCKMILYLVDPVDKFPRIKYWFPFFDIVAGCAPGDAEKYHIQYWDTPCVYNEQLSDIKTKYDVYIRAIDNGRGPLIKQCFDLFIKNGLSCDFHIQMDSKNNKYDGIDCTIDRIPYNAMLREELQARILLEVVVPGVGAGTTLRYKEAVLYKRKIVTNNPSVFTLPYYNPKYIHYFSKPEDIDMSWMKCDFDASYEYDGKFSTDSFCKRISNYYKSLN